MAEDSKPKKKTVSTRIPADEYEQLKAYCDRQDVSQADAVRRFVRDGLDLPTGPTTTANSAVARYLAPALAYTLGVITTVIGGVAL